MLTTKSKTVAHDNWKFLQNQFWTSTRNSVTRFLQLSHSHIAKLEAAKAEATAIDDAHKAYKPLHDNFVDQLASVDGMKAQLAKATKSVVNKLEEMNDSLTRWEGIIRGFFYKEPAYKHLLPKGTTVFRVGRRSERMRALTNLNTALKAYPELAKVQTEVQQMLDELVCLQSAQTDLKQDIKAANIELTQRHYDAAIQMHFNAAMLMVHFKKEGGVLRFFDLSIIRSTGKKDKKDEFCSDAAEDGEEVPASSIEMAAEEGEMPKEA